MVTLKRRCLALLHTYGWRVFPAPARRYFLYWLTYAIAPRPKTVGAVAQSPIIIVGLLRQTSGLGAAARASYTALSDAGIAVYGIDLTAALAHQVNHSSFEFRDGREQVGKGTLLLHVSGFLVPLALCLLGRRLVRNKRIIAHWFWELERLPPQWRYSVRFINEFCVNTRFVADAVRPISQGRPIHLVTYPMPQFSSPPTRPETNIFTVLVVFNIASNFYRKNPLAAIAAFRRAFGDALDTRLIIKYSHDEHWPKGIDEMRRAIIGTTNIELRGGIDSDAKMAELYSSADLVLSLHRSEGLGLSIAEAMRQGLPVVATDWSGSRDLLSSETGVPVKYRLVPVIDPQQNYSLQGARWAEPDIEDAARALRSLRADPALRRALGAAAARRAELLLCSARYCDQIRAILTQNSTGLQHPSRLPGAEAGLQREHESIPKDHTC